MEDKDTLFSLFSKRFTGHRSFYHSVTRESDVTNHTNVNKKIQTDVNFQQKHYYKATKRVFKKGVLGI